MYTGFVPDKIPAFHGHHEFLSNFHYCPIHYNGSDYVSAEHAYQSQKTLNLKERDKINHHRKKTTFEGKTFETS